MKNSSVFIFLLILVLSQSILSFEVTDNDQDENKFDDLRQISTLPFYSFLSSSLSSNGKQGNAPECLSKNLLFNMLSRDRRASISRPYFHHWRASRDNTRYLSKNLLAFSPRLGKRSNEDDNEYDIHINKRQVEDNNDLSDLDLFLAILVSHLQRKKIDIIYEDSTKICLSEPINNAFIREVLEKFDINRHQQEETPEQHSKGKHPLLFRYRLG